MHQHYWRDGTPAITAAHGTREWKQQYAAFLAKWEDPTYKIVAQTELPDGRWVSTVWLGMDHGFGERVLIFETLVWPEQDDMRRYSTEAEAVEGHTQAVIEYRAKATWLRRMRWRFLVWIGRRKPRKQVALPSETQH